MILYDLKENERNPAYEELAASNLVRQYGFLKSIAAAARARQPMISTALIKASLELSGQSAGIKSRCSDFPREILPGGLGDIGNLRAAFQCPAGIASGDIRRRLAKRKTHRPDGALQNRRANLAN